MPIQKLTLQKTVYQFALTASTGKAREVACFGARGDGKTIGALSSMLMHAVEHKKAGYPLPVRWLGVTDTFESHKNKTHGSLTAPLWAGAWKLTEGGHIARAGNLVELRLFGIKDQSEIDRVRTECVGVWFEEPAPAAVLIQSTGVNDIAWTTALTSQRIPSHAHPAIMTLNYPDENHWTWKRFVVEQQQGTTYFRVPPGELASPAARAEWRRALAGRPDLERRLLDGEPGVVMMGKPVAHGFSLDEHVSRETLKPVRGIPLAIGIDFGLTPTAVIGQDVRGTVRIYHSVGIERGGIRQLIEGWLRPWLGMHAPGFELMVGYDPAGDVPVQTDIDQVPARLLQELLGGYCVAMPAKWEPRKQALLTALNRRHGLLIDPSNKELISALSTRWYYKENRIGGITAEQPSKDHPWSDYGDATCYLLCRLGQTRTSADEPTSYKIERNLSWK